jgi:hypothetical protein
MHTMLRRSVTAIAASWALGAGCHSSAVPNQILTKPVPAAAPAAGAHTSESWAYRESTKLQSFSVDQHAMIRFDSSARIDTVSSHAEVTFTASPAAHSVNGSVGAFLVDGAGHAAATPAGLTTPFPLRAEYSVRAPQFDFTAPRDAKPCGSTALAVLQSLRDLWIKPPDTLRVGTSWKDSSSYFVCRDGIPLRAKVQRDFHVFGASELAGRLLLTISRISETAIEGSGTQFGEAVDVKGAGRGQLFYFLDPATGEIASANGTSSLEFSLRSRLRTQIVTQGVTTQIIRR